jgi:hypothetical protein
MATPPGEDTTDGAGMTLAQECDPPLAAPPTHAERTTRRLPATKAAPSKRAPANDKSAALSVAGWLALRKQVQAEMTKRQLDMAGLAGAIGRSVNTIANTMGKRSPPSAPIAALLRAFLTGPDSTWRPRSRFEPPDGGTGPASPPTPPAAPTAADNGHAVTTPDDQAKELARRLRAKRRPLPLTSTTLASQIGCTADQLDDALHARPIPPQAAERLAAWAAG